MGGDVEVQDSSAIVGYDEEPIEDLKTNLWNGEEIHGGDDFSMVAQECQPAARRIRLRTTSHPARDRSLRDVEAKHQQFAVNAAPHVGFSRAMRNIVCWSSAEIGFLPASPTSDFSRQ